MLAILRLILIMAKINHITHFSANGFCSCSSQCLVVAVVVLRTEWSSLDVGAIWSGNLSSLLASVLVLFNKEFNNFTIGQRAETIGLDGSLVHEDVLGSIIRNQETEALDGVEPKGKRV